MNLSGSANSLNVPGMNRVPSFHGSHMMLGNMGKDFQGYAISRSNSQREMSRSNLAINASRSPKTLRSGVLHKNNTIN